MSIWSPALKFYNNFCYKILSPYASVRLMLKIRSQRTTLYFYRSTTRTLRKASTIRCRIRCRRRWRAWWRCSWWAWRTSAITTARSREPSTSSRLRYFAFSSLLCVSGSYICSRDLTGRIGTRCRRLSLVYRINRNRDANCDASLNGTHVNDDEVLN